jgi:hypothetical protein
MGNFFTQCENETKTCSYSAPEPHRTQFTRIMAELTATGAKQPTEEEMEKRFCPKGIYSKCCDANDLTSLVAVSKHKDTTFPSSKAKAVYSNGKLKEILQCHCNGTVEEITACQRDNCSGEGWEPLTNYLSCKMTKSNGVKLNENQKVFSTFLPDCHKTLCTKTIIPEAVKLDRKKRHLILLILGLLLLIVGGVLLINNIF